MATYKYTNNLSFEEVIWFYTKTVYEPMLELHGSTPAVWKYKPCYISDIKREEDGAVTFKCLKDDYRVTDFDFKRADDMSQLPYAHNKQWLKFMCGKFGKQYLQDFVAYRNEEERRAIGDFTSEMKKQTEGYLNSME